MITLPSSVRVYLAAEPIDLRRGHEGSWRSSAAHGASIRSTRFSDALATKARGVQTCVQTRAFTFSDARFYVVDDLDGDDELGRSRGELFV